MIVPLSTLLLGVAGLTSALPTIEKRVVQQLNQAAFAEAQQRDATATRAFSSVDIKTSGGKCLFVDELSGDFRANLNPIQVGECDDSTGQKWDVITKGKHNNVADAMLIVNTLTQACMNFDPRRAAGDQVIMFSCGGRGDGSGQVQNAQLFPFAGDAGPLEFSPLSAKGTCFTVKGDVIDQAACNEADDNQVFTFGDGDAEATPEEDSSQSPAVCAAPAEVSSIGVTSEVSAATTTVEAAAGTATDASLATTASEVVTETTTSEAAPEITSVSASSSAEIVSEAPAATTAPATPVSGENPTSPVPVSRAGGVLNPSSAAEANTRDDTATRALSSVSLRSADGQCLFIDPTAGDFRENLIPIALKPCDGSANEKFDFITAGKHNNAKNSTLIVSSLTQGCLNFDARRATGDTVIMFSCGGRADGEGQTTNSQLFSFAVGEKSIQLAPENANGATCLVPKSGKLDSAACTNDGSQTFTIV